MRTAEEKTNHGFAPFSLNPTGTLSRRHPAQFVSAVDKALAFLRLASIRLMLKKLCNPA
jgi:hypothetical protein